MKTPTLLPERTIVHSGPVQSAVWRRWLGPLWLACLLPCSLFAYPGGPDTSFTQQGVINGPIYAVVVDNLTNISIGGRFTQVYGQSYPGLAVLHPDGTINSNFNPAVLAPLGGLGEVHALVVDGFHNVYIGAKNGIARLNYETGSSGWSLDSSFSANATAAADQVRSMAIKTTSGSLDFLWVVGNVHPYTNGIGVFQGFGRFGIAGNLDTSFSRNGSSISQVRFVPLGILGTNSYGSDHLIIAGSSGTGAIELNGFSSPSPLFFYSASCIAERPNTFACASGAEGDLVAGGNFGPSYDSSLFDIGNNLALNRLGGTAPDYFNGISQSTNFPADQGTYFSAIEAFPGGDVLVAGEFTQFGGVTVNNLAHLLPNGRVNTAFQNSVGLRPTAMAQQPDGKYLIVGKTLSFPFGGSISRRLAFDQPRAFAFTNPPAGATIYAGDSYCFTVGLDSWPPAPLNWVQNGTVLTNQTAASLCINSATTNDAGDYKLRAYWFCDVGSSEDSLTAHLNVLAAPAPPANDMFSNAIVLSGSAAVATGTLRSSTLEAGEPNPSGIMAGRSVWWRWTAPTNGVVNLDVAGCNFPASLRVYTGTAVGSLALIANSSGAQTSLHFIAVAGTTYRIAIGGVPPVGLPDSIVMSLGYRLLTWSQSVSGAASFLTGVAAGNGKLVTGGYPSVIQVSSNGTQWASGNSGLTPDSNIEGISYGNGLFLALAADSNIFTSANGTNWTSQTTGLSVDDYAWSAAFGNGLFAAVGNAGIIITSPDATNWTRRATGIGVSPDDWLYSIAYGNGFFAAVGDEATVVTSPDGTNWTLQASGLGYSDSLRGIAFGNGRFVAVGDSGIIVTSTNGTNWTPGTSGINGSSLNAVAYGNGRFVAVGENGIILLSTDGTNWVEEISGVTAYLNGVAYYQNSQFVIVGEAGTILMNGLPQFGPGILLLGNTIQFTLIGLSGATAIIEATPALNPTDWQPIATNVIVNGTVTLTTSRTNLSKRYYRGKVQ